VSQLSRLTSGRNAASQPSYFAPSAEGPENALGLGALDASYCRICGDEDVERSVRRRGEW
jgi:hypothetical protein